jgi:hypothetical protein
MAVLDSAYDMLSALKVAKDLSVLAGVAAEGHLSKLANLAEAASQSGPRYDATAAAQLMPHLQQRRILNKAAAATRQLQLMSEHLQTAASLASLHGQALEGLKVLPNTTASLPLAWLDAAPSTQGTVNAQVQRD